VIDLGERRLYLCTPDRPDLVDFLTACVRGGVDVVQLREKELEAKELIARARLARAVCADLGVPFILNDRPDLALEAGADGVHVGQEDAPATLARRILGPDAIIGLSTHSPSDLEAALSEPVDYLSAGPVVPTPTKPGRPGTGAEYPQAATRRAPWPVFVTGDVTPSRARSLATHGCLHFVAVRWLTEATHPHTAARQLRDAIDEALAPYDSGSALAFEPTHQGGDRARVGPQPMTGPGHHPELAPPDRGVDEGARRGTAQHRVVGPLDDEERSRRERQDGVDRHEVGQLPGPRHRVDREPGADHPGSPATLGEQLRVGHPSG
jgi:thiamine-phosphate pyrophosphorylase